LIEPDKRGESLRLAYPRPGEQFYISSNLYIIGTMNLADRSLALIDFALRRRFAFKELEPMLNGAWRKWCREAGMPSDLISLISERLPALNEAIAADRSLGRQFCVGHSFVTPMKGRAYADWNTWFIRAIKTEIAPLLREYWYDDDPEATRQIEKLLEGFPR
jgi:5-methylcytosine-specific restriction protein B